MSGFTPVNQVRLTNVATVRLQKRGKRFEIACYRNKVLSWRNKLETDIGEVLQIDTVFTNVSKGNLASSKDLLEAFGTSDAREVCKEILEKGEIQVSEQERAALNDSIFRDIANIVVEKTVNPTTNLPYTVTMIQNAMRQLQYSVNMSKSSKSQALDVIRKLKDIIPISRASMLLRVICSQDSYATLHAEFEQLNAQTMQKTVQTGTSEGAAETIFVDVKVDPEHFRRIEELVKASGDGSGRVEILQLRVAGTASTSSSSAPHAAIVSKAEEASTAADTTQPPIATKAAEKKSSSTLKSSRGDAELQELLAKITGDNGFEDEEDAEGDTSIHDNTYLTAAERRKAKKAAKKEAVVIDATRSESTATTSASNKQKTSKKDKKLERELQEEREKQAKHLQDRLLRQQETKKQQETELKSGEDQSSGVEEQHFVAAPALGESASSAISKIQSCNTCGGTFYDSKAYRDHFKSDWHRFNLKRKMKNLPPIPTEEAFLQLSVAELQL